ncbi:MAG TPA: inorganic diphosphatase [Bacteroidota bacterium]|nr:inorganic diphosphatase [Bacteroidota bacterium]
MFIEITPFEGRNYEVERTMGYLRVDWPQRTSSLPPILYGFFPGTSAPGGLELSPPSSTRGTDTRSTSVCCVIVRSAAPKSSSMPASSAASS